jgi:hypothetical protein
MINWKLRKKKRLAKKKKLTSEKEAKKRQQTGKKIKGRRVQLSLSNEDNNDESNYNIELSIEKSIEKEEKTVLTNNGMNKLLLIVSQNSLRAVKSERHRQLPTKYR